MCNPHLDPIFLEILQLTGKIKLWVILLLEFRIELESN